MYQQHQEKKIPVSARKPVKKKAKDKPKRPLSAYNYFFKEDRSILVAIVQNEDNIKELTAKDPNVADDVVSKLRDDVSKLRNDNPDITDEVISKLRKKDGKISFEYMGKIIGRRWKDITKEKKVRYEKLAEGDTDRYKAEMQKYNEKQEEIREKNKRNKEMQYAQMAAAQAQQNNMMPPSMIEYSDTQTSQPGIYPTQMGYPAPPYPMDQNAPYGYHPQMGMMGSMYNPYYMPMQQPSNNMNGNPTINGDVPDNRETSVNQDTVNNFYPPAQVNYAHNYGYPQQHANEYYQSENMSNNVNDLSFMAQQQVQGQKQTPPSQNLEADSNVSSSYPQQQQQQPSYNSGNESHINAY